MRRFLPLLLLLASMAAAGQAFDYAAYKPAKLAAITASIGSHPADWLATDDARHQTRATFTGRVRPISAGRKGFIGRWAQAMGHTAAEAEVFQQEAEISQDAVDYWMPVQDVLVSQLQAEVDAGSEADFYLLLMGARADGVVFAINEFDAPADAHAPGNAKDE